MTEADIIEILRIYRVQKHWRGSSEATAVRYAVFVDGQAVTKPTTHIGAQREREFLTARALLKAIEARPTYADGFDEGRATGYDEACG